MRIVVLIVPNDRPDLIKTTISACELAINVTQLSSALTLVVVQMAAQLLQQQKRLFQKVSLLNM